MAAKAFTVMAPAALARIAALEAQVTKLRAALQVAGNDATLEAGGTLTLRASVLKLESAGTLQLTASRIDASAGLAQFDIGMLKVSGVVRCDTMQATSVVASSYTPGAGNIW